MRAPQSSTSVTGRVQLVLQEGCDPSNFADFVSAVVVLVTENATEAQLAELERSFVESHDQASGLNDDICDPLFRQVAVVSSENETFALNRRRLQEQQTLQESSSASPSSVPTLRESSSSQMRGVASSLSHEKDVTPTTSLTLSAARWLSRSQKTRPRHS